MSDPYGSITLTTTERKAMNTYEFRGSYIYIVQAESEEAALNEMDAGFQEILFDWDIRETYHQEEE
jgi:hypothetical protein